MPISNGLKILENLENDHPELNAEIVISSRLGQIDIQSSERTALQEFPQLFYESPEKRIALKLLDEIRAKERYIKFRWANTVRHIKQEIESSLQILAILVKNLEIDTSVHIELRFLELDFDLVRIIQKSPHVDQVRTPQSRSSINIVFGTLEDLSFDISTSQKIRRAELYVLNTEPKSDSQNLFIAYGGSNRTI